MSDKRAECLAYIVKNYKQWPSESTRSRSAARHHGYGWRKFQPNMPWVLENRVGDVITEANCVKHYEDNVKMSTVFETGHTVDLSEFEGDEDITMTFSVPQYRALCIAIRRYDGMKAKLNHARATARRLAAELGE